MFGRKPKLPIDVTFKLHRHEKQLSIKLMKDLQERLAEAYQLATKAAEKARAKQKEGYDTKIRGVIITSGDRVLEKKAAFDGKQTSRQMETGTLHCCQPG